MNYKLLVAGALALPMAAQAVEISASGHINRALVFSGLADAPDVKHTDAASSGSRFRFKGSEELDNGITVGATLEFAAWGSADASDAPNDSPATVPTMRHASIELSSGGFGKLAVGQTAPATHLISYAGLDNLAWLSGTEIGCDFCTASGMKSSVFTTFGPGRMQLVRYETPSLGPIKLSFSADGNDFWDAALRTSGEAGSIAYSFHAGFTNYGAGTPAADATNIFVGKPLPAAAPTATQTVESHRDGVGYNIVDADGNLVKGITTSGWDDDTGTQAHWAFTPAKPAKPASKATTLSAAFGLPQGTHFNITWGRKEPDSGADDQFVHFGIGHNMDDTSIAATYTDSDIGGGGASWAVGVGHVMGGVEMYTGYKYLDHDAAAVEDYGFFVIGSRVKFN